MAHRLTCGAILALCTCFSTSQDTSKGMKLKTESSATEAAAVSEAFEKVKALAGEWEAPYDGKIMKDTFRVVSGGSAVLHTESWNGDVQGAVSLIYPNGNELWLDHYCDLENQPRFTAHPQQNSDVVVFELREITNLKSSGAEYFHRGTFYFVDRDHHIQDWQWFMDGKQKEILRLEFKRVK